MINLLADTRKSAIMAARTNVIILRYTGIVVLAFAFMLGALVVSYTLLESTMKSAESLIESNSSKVEESALQVQENSALITQINQAQSMFSQEVHYSEALIAIGEVMPEGSVIGKVNFTDTSFLGAPTDLTIYAQSASDAENIRASLERARLFTSVSLLETEESSGPSGYPAVITMTITLDRNGV